MDVPTCPRHPDVETRLRCSACDTLICPDCASEAAVGYKCPDCKAAERADDAASTQRSGASAADQLGARLRSLGSGQRDSDGGSAPSRGASGAGSDGSRSPTATNVRATMVGAAAAFAGGLLLAPILVGGMLSLLSAGVIGWLVARSVYWASEERNSPYLRGAALSLSVLAVAIGIAQASGMATVSEIAYLGLPVAAYGGWIVVRQR